MDEKLNRRDAQDGREIMEMIDAREMEADVRRELQKRRDQGWMDYILECGGGHGK